MRAILLVVTTAALLAACETTPTRPAPSALTCASLTGSNCFKDVVADAASCLPGDGAVGQFTKDLTTCVFQGTGIAVKFDGAVMLPLDPAAPIAFTITKTNADMTASTCMRVSSSPGSFSIASSKGTVQVASTDTSFLLSCPSSDPNPAASLFSSDTASLLAAPECGGPVDAGTSSDASADAAMDDGGGGGGSGTPIAILPGVLPGGDDMIALVALTGTSGTDGLTTLFRCQAPPPPM